MSVAGWLLTVMLMTTPAMTSSDRDVTEGGVEELRLAVIVPYDERRLFSRCKVLPAVRDALKSRDVTQRLVPGQRFRVFENDSHCRGVEAPIAAIDLHYQHKVHAFLGPVCDFSVAPVARYSSYWNKPVLSAGAMARDFGDNKREEFGLLTRVGGVTFDSLIDALIAVIEHHHWNNALKVMYVSTGHSEVADLFCFLAMSGVVKELRMRNHAVDVYPITDDEGHVTYDEIVKVLRDEVGVRYAIVVLCASPDTVREIMIAADALNFDNGEYVFFSIDLFASKSALQRPWYRDNDTTERNDAARRGYEAVLIVTLRHPDSHEYHQFAKRVRQRAIRDYGYDVYGDEVNSFVAAFYDAVLLYTQAVSEALRDGFDPTNGTDITRRMWNRTFQGITGTVSIDANGDRNGDYSLLDMNPKTGRFQVSASLEITQTPRRAALQR